MKFLLLGTSDFAISCAKGLLKVGEEVCGFISLEKNLLPENSANVELFCANQKINFFETTDINSQTSVEYIKNLNPDYIIASWPKLIKKSVLNIPNYIVIGSHPTSLPMNQGRHPLHWMIVLGIRASNLSFFIMDEGIDTGRILIQEPFTVGSNINFANQSLNNCGYNAVQKLVTVLKNNPDYDGSEQSFNNQNYLRKRTQHDVTLDPRFTFNTMKKVVESFTHPYPCARLYFQKHQYVTISKVELSDENKYPENWFNFGHGHVFQSDSKVLTMRINDTVVDLHLNDEAVSEKIGKNIHPPTFYL